MSLPPLGLNVEVRNAAGGNVARWDSHGDVGDRPQDITFTTSRGDGFGAATCKLSRLIDGEYVDLGLLRDLKIVGEDGSVAYEGRVTGLPRSMDQVHSIGVQAAGWMAHAKDRKFREIYLDRDLSRWTGPSVQRKVNYTDVLVGSPTQAVVPDASTGRPALETALTGAWVAPASAEAWYDAGGIPLGKLGYRFRAGSSVNVPDPNWIWNVALLNDDIATGFDISANLRAASGAGELLATTKTRDFALAQLRYNTAAGSAGVAYQVFWEQLAVYGAHGLTQRGEGFYVSDLIRNIAQRFAPLLDTSGVQATTYPVPHCVFRDRIYPYDAFTLLNAYHRWNLSVWEDRTLTFSPVDLTDYDWEVRLGDHGVKLELQGDSASDLANGIAVSYTDVITGQKRSIDPTTNPELATTDLDNPATVEGLDIWTELDLSFPVTTTMAAQLGRAALAEFNTPKSPGTIRITGHVRDRAGHLQPVWKVRADDRIVISNFANARPRLITGTSYGHEGLTNAVSVEAPPQRLDAVLDRITGALSAAGLS